MRCEEVRKIIAEDWPEEAPAAVREHLAGCPACDALARDDRLVRAGFHALAAEPAPEPSWGFSTRLLRRLQESPAQEGAEFLERVGRRVVYATFLLALTLLLALALPSSGPLRGPTTADLYLAQSESEVVTAGNDPILTGEFPENNGAVPATPGNGGAGKKQ
jgi:anti-sigma factor RsiW